MRTGMDVRTGKGMAGVRGDGAVSAGFLGLTGLDLAQQPGGGGGGDWMPPIARQRKERSRRRRHRSRSTSSSEVIMKRRVVKSTAVLDQGDDSEVFSLEITEVRQLAHRYKQFNCGIGARLEEEATADQLAALRARVLQDLVPFADFGVFRPYAERLQRTMRFQAKVFNPADGTWMSKELAGPANYEEWRRSWRVYRYALLVLGIATNSRLERYFERFSDLVRSHGTLGGHSLWWILAQADMRMRSERFEALRRQLESERAELVARGRGAEAELDPRKPWDSVFLRASEDELFWTQQVKETAYLYLSSLKSKGEIVDDGHHVLGVPPASGYLAIADGASAGSGMTGVKKTGLKGVPSAPGEGKKAKRNAARQAAELRKLRQFQQDVKGGKIKGGGKNKTKGGGKRSGETCFRWTKDDCGCTDPCPNGRQHPVCPLCKKSHPWKQPCPV